MAATILNIEDKHKKHFGIMSSPNDFKYTQGDSISSQVILDNPHLSLYCLDDTGKRAIFVELPEDVDLSVVPFVYKTQFDYALRLIEVSFAELHQLAEQVGQVLEHLILIFSPGRCGSTLLSHLLTESGAVYSLSEPDVFTQLAKLRGAGGGRDKELVNLIRDCATVIFKSTQPASSSTFALKLRNQCLPCIDLFHTAFPQANNLFLCRNPVDNIASFYRLFLNAELPDKFLISELVTDLASNFGWSESQVLQYAKLPETEDGAISMLEGMTIYWLILIDQFLKFQEQGIPMLVLHYEALNRHRKAVVTKLFERCELPVDSVGRALKAFERDAQRGTDLARDTPNKGSTFKFTSAQIAEINRILSRHPIVKSTDYVIPSPISL